VRVISNQSETSISSATPMMKARVAGNSEQIAGPSGWHCSSAARPQAKPRLPSGWLSSVKAEPCSSSGGRNSTAIRPQISCTSSKMMYDKPKVTINSGTCPYLCTLRRLYFSNKAPSSPTSSGTSNSAAQKPTICETAKPM